MKGLTLHGRATAIPDGDGFTLSLVPPDDTHIYPDDVRLIKCRLAWIDAPEMTQRYGPESRASLYHLIAAQNLTVNCFATDKYQRRIVSVYNQHLEHVNYEMIFLGAAWYQPRYGKGPPRLLEADRHARTMRQGLWHFDNPTNPADHRSAAALLLGHKRTLANRRNTHATKKQA